MHLISRRPLREFWAAGQGPALGVVSGDGGYVFRFHEQAAEIGDREDHPLVGLLDVVTFFVRDYEQRAVEIPDATPAEVLRLLMDHHHLRQADLAEIFGAQSNVSEVLSGKREINARQVRALAERFRVSPAIFI